MLPTPTPSLLVPRPAKVGSSSLIDHLIHAYECHPPLALSFEHFPQQPMVGQQVLLMLREPCERFVSAWHYSRLPAWLHDWDARMHLALLHKTESPMQWAQQLLADEALRQQWMVANRQRENPQGESIEVFINKTHTACHRNLGYLCGFVPLAEYAPAGDVHHACLDSLGADVAKILLRDYKRCWLRPGGSAQLPHIDGYATTHNSTRIGAYQRRTLCPLVWRLYERDRDLYVRHCGAHVERAQASGSTTSG